MAAGIQLQTIIDCEVNEEDDAHNLGRELKDRIRNYLTQLIPNLRNIQTLKSGTISFNLTVRGQRIRITNSESGAAVDRGQKKGQ